MMPLAHDTLANVKDASKEVKDATAELRPKFRQTATFVEQITQKSQSGIQAWNEEWTDAQYKKLRRDALASPSLITASVIKTLEEVKQEYRQSQKPQLDAILRNLNDTSRHLAVFLGEANDQFNRKFIPSLTVVTDNLGETSKQLTATTQELATSARLISQSSNLTLEEIRGFIADPKWDEALSEAVFTLRNVEKTSRNVAAASEKVPTIAATSDRIMLIGEKIIATTSRYQKLVLFAQLLSAVIPSVRALY